MTGKSRLMGQPLNWMLSGSGSGSAKQGVRRRLRNQLALTTILAVVPFLGYGRQAYAACVEIGTSAVWQCSDTTTGQNIFDNNADVSTLNSPPFVVTDDGLFISGDGDQRFTDTNASTITNNGYFFATGLSVVSTGDDGQTPGAVTIYTNGTITGNGHGIYAYNGGTGDITITANGTVTGVDVDEVDFDYMPNDGINARNFGNNLTIITGVGSAVSGEHNGIDARNYGIGDLSITTNGDVTGNEFDAIYALNYGGALNVTVGAQSVVYSPGNGIGARNYGDGALDIKVYGHVTSTAYDGVRAYNYNGSALNVTTGAQSVVYGDDNGIDARNFSEDAALVVNADGYVTGYNNDAIYAKNYGTDLTVTTAAGSVVRGGGNGIGAYNYGSGNLTVTANGLVGGYSEDGDGIHAYNSENGGNLTVTTGATSDVFGGKDGIDAFNNGSGFLKITANGGVTGEDGHGIYAENNGGYLKILTGVGSVVTGDEDGINATQRGLGVFEITVNGEVTGYGTDYSWDDKGYGINAYNGGNSSTNITVGATGLVQGYQGGISVRSFNYQPIGITNNGIVQNLSGESDDLAIITKNGQTHIDNNNTLIGFVEFSAIQDFDDVLDNAGFWNTSNGTSYFGFGEDVVNNTGTLRAADDPTTSETTTLSDLETFNNNSGLITLVDGKADDELVIGPGNGGTLVYTGNSGKLAVDGELGPAGTADLLTINGIAQGTTTVHVNVVSASGANFIGIPVVRVTNGTVEDNFNLDAPFSAGFFTWDMRLDGDTHELYTLSDPNNPGNPTLGAGAFEFPSGFTAGQDLWFLTIGTLLHRQADLRSVLQGLGVTPVADFSEPVEPTPIATVTPGFWFKGLGAYVERDDEQNGFDLDRTQTIYGGMAGFDFGSQDGNSVWLFGLFGGYLTSDLDFKATNTEWNYEGPTAGAYVTYMNDAFYADLTVKADFLDIDIDPEDLGAGEKGDTDALNIGGRIDTGYKFGQTAFIEPQASLAVVHTEIDDVDIFGGTVEFDDETSVRGRLGLRLGVDHTGYSNTVFTGDVTASVWENFTGGTDVTIVDSGVPDFGVSDDPSDTYGDVSVGLSAANPDGWSSFLRANYLFAEDYEAVTGSAGVRFAW